MFYNVVNVQFKIELYPRHHTIFFLVEEVFLGAAEAWGLLARTGSRYP